MDDLLRDVDALLLDLDGTLADTFQDIADAVNGVRAGHGLPALSLEDVTRLVGKGAAALVASALGPRDAAAAAADLDAFRRLYAAHLLDRTTTYPGVPEALAGFRARGLRLAVLSNKPEAMTVAVVQGLGLSPYLEAAWGGGSFPVLKPDPGAVAGALARLGVPPARALMVGDSDTDLEAAAGAGVRSVRVRTGQWRDSRRVPDVEVGDLRELLERLDSHPR